MESKQFEATIILNKTFNKSINRKHKLKAKQKQQMYDNYS